MEVRYTLVGDGPFDCALMPVIRWALLQHLQVISIAGEFAEPHRLPRQADGLAARVMAAIALYPCNLLFVHRDAEGQGRQQRLTEIATALNTNPTPFVPVIPIRMTEAWLLTAEDAIRRASGNPNGQIPLNLPVINRLETRPDPKHDLHQALITASMLTGRQLRRFDERVSARRVAELITDYSPLRGLSAFRDFESDLAAALATL